VEKRKKRKGTVEGKDEIGTGGTGGRAPSEGECLEA
jgi:hypothetical protein